MSTITKSPSPSLVTPSPRQFHDRFNLPDPSLHAQSLNAEDLTKQSFKDECDINAIMRRYQETGVLEHIREDAPRYLDATTYDFEAAMQLVAEAESMFEELPSAIRDRFDNDPVKLLDFVHDSRHLEESIAMGLIDPAKLPKPAEGTKAEPAPITPEVKSS